MCFDSTFVRYDVRDMSRYDVRRVFENVLLITLTMFFVCSFLHQMFVSESKRHVSVIICCDKFAHDFSSSIKIVLDVFRFDVRQKHDVHEMSRYIDKFGISEEIRLWRKRRNSAKHTFFSGNIHFLAKVEIFNINFHTWKF
jgi:hypothetical protein